MRFGSFFCFLFLQCTLWSGLVEWVGPDSWGGAPEASSQKPVFLDPPLSVTANTPVHIQLQYFLAQKNWSCSFNNEYNVGKGNVGKGDVIICNNLSFGAYEHLSFFTSLSPAKIFLVVWEPPTVYPFLHDTKLENYFDKIFTWDLSKVDNKKYFHFCYPVLTPMGNFLPSFSERKLACMILTNKTSTHPSELYSTRKSLIRFYSNSHPSEFDLYGFGWEACNFTCYRGTVEDKDDTLKKYRFSFAFENFLNDVGYITEKLFDCFRVGTIPIYLGATNVTAFVPASCFIDARKFPNFEAIHQYLKNMDEATWLSYQENIRCFLDSPEAQKFSARALTETLMQAIVH